MSDHDAGIIGWTSLYVGPLSPVYLYAVRKRLEIDCRR